MIELLRRRRSIRKYLDKKVDPEKVEILKEALLRSPSSRNLYPWEFILVDNKELLKKLSKAKKHGSQFLEGAPLGIVICGNEKESDVWVEDCSIASIIVQITAHSLGLGSCWIQIRKRMYNEKMTSEQYIRELLDLPDHLSVESIISVGYPTEKKEGIPYKQLNFSKIREIK